MKACCFVAAFTIACSLHRPTFRFSDLVIRLRTKAFLLCCAIPTFPCLPRFYGYSPIDDDPFTSFFASRA
jgi:hypothetical protein